MNRNNLPLFFMLTSGAVVCIITFIKRCTMLEKTVCLLLVLIIFGLLGSILKWMLNRFDRENERRRQEEGEVIEKEAVDGEEGSEEQAVRKDTEGTEV